MTTLKIKFILGQISQPRCLKRLEAIKNAGFEIAVYGFDNGLYNENIRNKDYKIHSIRIDGKGNKFVKSIKKILFIKKVCSISSSHDILYAFGIDIAFWVYLFTGGRRKYIYEEADLNYTKFSNKYIVRFFKSVDKYLIRHSYYAVLTSDGFVEYVYEFSIPPKQIIVLPNKLNVYFRNVSRNFYELQNVEKIRFGFIGAVRYPNTIVRFAEVVGKYFPQYEFTFWGTGIGINEAMIRCETYNNVKFEGAFRNPEDLETIYSNIDINIVCYDTTYFNVTIAEPNKLYESIFFGKPMVVSANTFLATKVKEWGIGFAANCSTDIYIKEFISSLGVEQINRCIKNCAKIQKEELIDSTTILIEKIV